MAVKNVDYRLNRGSAITDRAVSPNIWGDCPWSQIVEGIVPGVYFFDDFASFPKTPATTEGNWSQYAQFSSTGGAITAGTGQGGEAIFGSDDDNEGASIRTLATPFKIIRNGSQGKFWFECRVKLSTVADTTFEFFVGLMEDAALTATVPITATAATLADQNLVGFYRTESDGDAINTTYKANGVTAVTVGTGEVVPAASTYMKLGMKFEPAADPLIPDPTLANANKFVLSFYLNNLRLTSTKQIPSAAGTDFPNDVGLGLVLAVRNAAGSSPGTATIDWWRAAQLIGA
jgi:hypothetical protein